MRNTTQHMALRASTYYSTHHAWIPHLGEERQGIPEPYDIDIHPEDTVPLVENGLKDTRADYDLIREHAVTEDSGLR